MAGRFNGVGEIFLTKPLKLRRNQLLEIGAVSVPSFSPWCRMVLRNLLRVRDETLFILAFAVSSPTRRLGEEVVERCRG